MSSANYGMPVPGLKTERTYTPRNIWWGEDHRKYIPGGVVLDGTLSRDQSNTGATSTLQPGILLGRPTGSAKYAPSVLGLTATAYTSGATALTLTAAAATELSRRIGSTGSFTLVGAPTLSGTIASATVAFSAVNTSTGVVTVTNIGANVHVGALVMPADGSQTILGILDDHRRMTDIDGVGQDTQGARVAVGGLLDDSQVVNWPATTATSLVTWLKGQLNSPGVGPGTFTFKTNFAS